MSAIPSLPAGLPPTSLPNPVGRTAEPARPTASAPSVPPAPTAPVSPLRDQYEDAAAPADGRVLNPGGGSPPARSPVDYQGLARHTRDLAYELRHGRGDINLARHALNQLNVVLMNTPPREQGDLLAATRELGAAIRNRTGEAAPRGAQTESVAPSVARPPPPQVAAAAQRIGERVGELLRADPNPTRQALDTFVTEGLFARGGQDRDMLAALAHCSEPQLRHLLEQQPAIPRARIDAVMQSVHGAAAFRFHQQTQRTASEAIGQVADQYQRAADGDRAALDALTRPLTSGNPYPTLATMQGAGAPGAAEMRRLVEQRGLLPQHRDEDLRGLSRDAINQRLGQLMQNAAGHIASQARELRQEMGNGRFWLDHTGDLYRMFPRGAQQTLESLGVSGNHANDILQNGGGRYGRTSVLDHAVTGQIQDMTDTRHLNERVKFASALLASCALGGLGVAGEVIGIGLSAFQTEAEHAHAAGEAGDLQIGELAGLTATGAADAARTEATQSRIVGHSTNLLGAVGGELGEKAEELAETIQGTVEEVRRQDETARVRGENPPPSARILGD